MTDRAMEPPLGSSVRLRPVAFLVVLALALAGCGSDEAASPFIPVRAAQVSGELPAPTGQVVLDVLDGDQPKFQFGLELLEQLETVEVTVLEPFLEEEHTYTGVPMASLFSLVGMDGATEVRLVALDDYVVSLPPGDFEQAILATRQDGAPIAVADGGPIRVIFAGESEAGRNTDNWIWSVRTMAAV